MGFKDKKLGDTIYMFDADAAEFKEGSIQSVSQPKMDMNVPSGLVVDVVITFDGNRESFVFLADAEVAHMGSTTFSPALPSILESVKAAKARYQDIINGYDTAKERLTKCEAIMKQLDPEMKRAVADEERWRKVEGSIKMIADGQRDFLTRMESCIGKLTDLMSEKMQETKQPMPQATKKTQQTLL